MFEEDLSLFILLLNHEESPSENMVLPEINDLFASFYSFRECNFEPSNEKLVLSRSIKLCEPFALLFKVVDSAGFEGTKTELEPLFIYLRSQKGQIVV